MKMRLAHADQAELLELLRSCAWASDSSSDLPFDANYQKHGKFSNIVTYGRKISNRGIGLVHFGLQFQRLINTKYSCCIQVEICMCICSYMLLLYYMVRA